MAYSDPIIQRYQDLIKTNCPQIKAFYQGEPTRTPTTNLPCVVISKIGTRALPLSNSDDRHYVALRITVIADIRQDLSTAENDAAIVEGVSTLYDLVEGRDSSTLSLKPDSVLGILRGNLMVDLANELRTDLDSASEVDYGETLGNRDPSIWRIEARVDIVAHYTQTR